jgi:hypothetical protein
MMMMMKMKMIEYRDADLNFERLFFTEEYDVAITFCTYLFSGNTHSHFYRVTGYPDSLFQSPEAHLETVSSYIPRSLSSKQAFISHDRVIFPIITFGPV